MIRIAILILFVALIIGCSSSESELFKDTDSFVESLQTTGSYDILEAAENSKKTSNGLYAITPVGRMINVKIRRGVQIEAYEKLKQDLQDHYRNDSRVNDVFICNAGTIMIDCRN